MRAAWSLVLVLAVCSSLLFGGPPQTSSPVRPSLETDAPRPANGSPLIPAGPSAFSAVATGILDAPIDVDNHIAVSGVVTSSVWSGTITMTGDVVIAAGATITITPGTTVRATTTSDWSAPEGIDDRVELIVYGRLLAEVESGQAITLTSAADLPEPADWYGLRFLDGGWGYIHSAVVEYGVCALSLVGDVSLSVYQSTLRRNLRELSSGDASAAGINASGAFVLILQDSLLIDNRVHITGTADNIYGGHIYLSGGLTQIEHTQILTPTAQFWSYAGSAFGGGIYAEGDSNLLILDSQIVGNTVHGDHDSAGGGLYLANAWTWIEDSAILNNTAEDEKLSGFTRGGGIFVAAGAGLGIIDSTIAGNTALGYWPPMSPPMAAWGGGIYNEGNLTLLGVTVRDNRAVPWLWDEPHVGGRGAGICIMGGSATIEKSVISGNMISITNSPAYGAGLFVGAGDVQVVNTLIVSNSVTPCYFDNLGGGVYASGGSATLINCAIVGNSLIGYGGGAAFAGGAMSISNTIVVGNTAYSGGGIYQYASSPYVLGYNDVWGNAGGNYYPPTITGTGDISADPLFVDSSSDYHLRPGSPCVDMASPVGAPPYDVDDDPRPLGPGYEIGLDEIDELIVELVANNDSPTVLGNPTVLSATIAAGSRVHFAWDLGDGTIGSGSVLIHTYPTAGFYTATVAASNSVSLVTATTVVDVEQIIADLSATNDSPTALGQPTAFTATVVGGSNVSYLWDFGDETAGLGPAPHHTYLEIGIYAAQVTAYNRVSLVTATTTVTVEQAIADLSATNDSPTVLGSPTKLSATITAGTNVTYTWALGDGTMGSGAVVTHTYPAVGPHTATVTASNPVSLLTATTVVVVGQPIAGLVATNDSPTALGRPTTLTATVTAGSDVTYAWSFGDGTYGHGAVVSHDYPDVATYTAIVTASNAVSMLVRQTTVNVFRPWRIYLPLICRIVEP